MTEEQIKQFVGKAGLNIDLTFSELVKLQAVVNRVAKAIDRSDPLSRPLVQTEIDYIVNVYPEIYTTQKAKVATQFGKLP